MSPRVLTWCSFASFAMGSSIAFDALVIAYNIASGSIPNWYQYVLASSFFTGAALSFSTGLFFMGEFLDRANKMEQKSG